MSILLIVAALVVIGALTCRIANEWSRAVVLRLGRFHSIRGPGVYFLIPLVDIVTTVIDLRIRTVSITAEQALYIGALWILALQPSTLRITEKRWNVLRRPRFAK
jgi:regulator of protease activity HflC (stomatin/prohibitin superfamily)